MISQRSLSFLYRFLVVLALGIPGAWQAASAQIFKLSDPDTVRGSFFGTSVSVDGNRALIGASAEQSCGVDAGAAYVFERDPRTDTWRQAARLLPRDCEPGIFFGRSVSLSGDRALIAASPEFFAAEAPDAAYVFERDTTGSWAQTAKLTVDSVEPEGPFAASVSIDGRRALVTTWGDPSHGQYHGAAYIFEQTASGAWVQVARLTPDGPLEEGIFGGAGDLDGEYLAVAASTYFEHRPGSVYVFEREDATGTWTQAARIGGVDDFFISLDLDTERLLVGESKAGRQDEGTASLFARNPSGRWHRTATFRPAKPYEGGAFGTAVSLHGHRALVAGYDEQLGYEFNIDRVVYVFAYDPGTNRWTQQRVVDIGKVAFGTAIDHHGSISLIGHATEDAPGAVYVVHMY